ncbi:MAG: hypothetical protein QOI10_1533 [Solirubrobacterales bacterium]|jgi:hypothetical protein|nr:hypothetical protein [Solirubrobacterales bacterium]
MLGTYASMLICLGASTAVGAAIFVACGRRRWSRLSPAVGLAALCPLAWWTVRLPGEGTAAIVAIAIATALAAAYALPRVTGLPGAIRRGVAIELAAVALASLPFIVEWRFGILGTGLNPDMSQHLFAVDRLASGGSERLISEGYPLGPHSIVAAVSTLGPSTVQAFDGLMLAVVVATTLVAIGVLEHLVAWRRAVGALLVGFAYLLASTFVQGSFKEAIEALLVLAFAVGLAELVFEWPLRRTGPRQLRAIPLAVLAIGAIYSYSFPGLLWLVGAVAVWAVVELGRLWRRGGFANVSLRARPAMPTVLVAAGLVLVASLPELGRMIDFASFETFDPAGSGLGNLFDRLSPLQALGIWPSGDFRVEPGDGAVPGVIFYLGSAIGAIALGFGLRWWWRERERAVPAALVAAAALWLYSRLAGTPYQEAKALVLAAPLVMLIAVRSLLEGAPDVRHARRIVGQREIAYAFPGRARVAKQRLATGALAVLFLAAAAGSSLLVLVNGPVGPSGYSPQLAELGGKLGGGSVLVLAPAKLLDDEHGADWVAWELRGHRICIAADGEATAADVGASSTLSVRLDDDGAVVPEGAYVNRSAQPPGDCDLIPDTARANPSAGG